MPEHDQRGVLHVGTARTRACGVLDYAQQLDEVMTAHGTRSSLRFVRAPERRGLLRGLRDDLHLLAAAAGGDGRPTVVLHYSPFAYGARGLPLLVPLLGLVLRLRARPLVLLLHELAYPPGGRSPRQAVWAWWQSRCLRVLVRRAVAAVVTTPERSRQLAALAPGLPRLEQPVWSPLPFSETRAPVAGRLASFGWGAFADAVDLALDALQLLKEDEPDAHLVLIGGDSSGREARRWKSSAEERGLGGALRFSGYLPPEEIVQQLSQVDVYLHLDRAGPAPRKTSLAAALQAGLPIVALDGPQTWLPLARSRLVEIVTPEPAALAGAVVRVRTTHDESGTRGFYDTHMSAPVGAARISQLIQEAQCASWS